MFSTYFALTAALVITPGATTAVIVRNALAGGWRSGVWAAIGAAAGNSTHAAVAGLGLAVVLTRSPRLFAAIQLAGGLYLAWLAIQSLRRVISHRALPASSAILASSDPIRAHHAWREGLSVNLLNPSIATFYLAVVPSFVPASADTGYYVGLAATHVGLAFAVHTAWAVSLDRLRHVLASPRARVILEGTTAVTLGLLAVRVILAAA
ncbi:MAG: LysE family translocator [Acidimicrobiia bacterium]|nr:LysE family translocator [Acidimicrobiia bacterium]